MEYSDLSLDLNLDTFDQDIESSAGSPSSTISMTIVDSSDAIRDTKAALIKETVKYSIFRRRRSLGLPIISQSPSSSEVETQRRASDPNVLSSASASRAQKPRTPEEEEKRKTLKEKNKLAARKSRAKNKEKFDILQKDCAKLEETNERLKTTRGNLEDELADLERIITSHQRSSKCLFDGLWMKTNDDYLNNSQNLSFDVQSISSIDAINANDYLHNGFDFINSTELLDSELPLF